MSPDFCDMRDGEIAQDSAPVWIVGGGKTAMDTALALITAQPSRSVNLLAGSGTFFSRRDYFFATGGARWWRRTLAAATSRRWPTPRRHERPGRPGHDPPQVRYRSPNEPIATSSGSCPTTRRERIRAGLDQTRLDYLHDAEDSDDGVELQLRSGKTLPVEPGTWIVNCTGYFGGRDGKVHDPYTSESGRTVVVGRTPMFGFTSFAAYFLTHLSFQGKITTVPLYQLDSDDLLLKSKADYTLAAATLVQYNLGLAVDALPLKVMSGFGLDFDRWYAAPRTLLDKVRFVAGAKRKRPNYRASLDTVAEQYDVRCGPVAVFREGAVSGS